MIDNISLIIIEEGISVIIERDMVHDFCHCGIIDFNSNDANELSVMIHGNVIGNHASIQILRDVRRQPNAFSCCLWHSEPDQ